MAVTLANVKAFLQKWWKAIAGTVAFCFVLYERSKMKSLEVDNTLSKANEVDAGLAQKQVDIETTEAQVATSTAQAEAAVSSETASQVAKDLNSV